MCAPPNRHGIDNVRVQMRYEREEKETDGKERKRGKREMGEKREREKSCVCVCVWEREKDRVVGGDLSYASGVRPFVRVATVNVGTVRYKMPTNSSL